MKLVLADDNQMVRDGLRLVIEQALSAVEIVEVETLKGLAHAAQEGCPDVFVLDWELPGSSHIDLVETLRHYCPDAILIALSARPEGQCEAQLAGVDRVFSKGEPPDELFAYLVSLKAG